MHQDLYSVLFSDGAPAWATLTGGASHIAPSPVWSDAYFTSPAVQAALDAFWNNSPAPDGVGLQVHFASLWGRLARHFSRHPNLVGYDLFNEPFLGSQASVFQSLLFTTAAGLLAESGIPLALPAGADPQEAIGALWLTPEGRFDFLQILRDSRLYTQIIDSTQGLVNEFEQKHLVPCYRRISAAIRQEDPSRIVFLETTMGSNMGVVSAIEPLLLPDGARDPQQAYAPHGYDLVTDTENLAQASPERIKLIFGRHAQTAQRLNLPMLVGEWGAYGDAPGTLPAAWQAVHVFEKLLCSETYWAHIPGIEQTDSFSAIQRPYPERIAGKLLDYYCDPQAKSFTCTWQEREGITAPNRFYLPGWLGWEDAPLALKPWGVGCQVKSLSPEGGSAFLEIPPTGGATRRSLSIGQEVKRSHPG
jgi:endoglycosylceramidase